MKIFIYVLYEKRYDEGWILFKRDDKYFYKKEILSNETDASLLARIIGIHKQNNKPFFRVAIDFDFNVRVTFISALFENNIWFAMFFRYQLKEVHEEYKQQKVYEKALVSLMKEDKLNVNHAKHIMKFLL